MVQEEQNRPVIELSNLVFDWPGQRFGLEVDHFAVQPQESVLLLGESGAGKSTLLSLICGILAPQQGTVQIAGQDLGALSGSRRDRFRADHIGIIFQMFNLLPYATALDNILLPLRFSPARRSRAQNPRADALALASALGLPEALVTRGTASALSVGQQQRVAVARAMIGSPPIVIADEPTSALDAKSQDEFLDLMFAQIHASGAAVLMVSHDQRLAARFDRTVRLEQIATPRMAGAAPC